MHQYIQGNIRSIRAKAWTLHAKPSRVTVTVIYKPWNAVEKNCPNTWKSTYYSVAGLFIISAFSLSPLSFFLFFLRRDFSRFLIIFWYSVYLSTFSFKVRKITFRVSLPQASLMTVFSRPYKTISFSFNVFSRLLYFIPFYLSLSPLYNIPWQRPAITTAVRLLVRRRL